MLDDLLTLFRRRRAPVRARTPAPRDGGWRIDLQTTAGPMFPGRTERIPRAGPQMRAQRHPADHAYAEQQYAEQRYLERQYAEQQLAQQHQSGQPYAQQAYAQPRHDDYATRQPPPQQAVQHGYLAAHAVEKTFGSRRVVKGASLYVRRGEAVGLLGPNGAGKTTIFYMITGLIAADRGRIELDGHDVTALPMYQRARLGIGYLPQEASIFRGLNVEDNIRSVLEVVEPNRKRREQDLEALLEEFGIARLRKTPSIALSGGERRRVEIARALASRPNYMLLDEPFAGIDPIAVGDLQALVRHLTNRGIGVLITDHNVRETLGLTDRAYIIYSGEVLMEGRPDDIVNNPDVRRLYLGEEFRL
ncbi:MAG: LPS export ABC transporter ATP-binding protein [Alphaproteobacteria bacterium]|nr:LPS export ABC transporter ATP-binding protein [Alphaproteobacteria bacterium]